MKQSIILIFTIVFPFILWAQSKDGVFLKWKLKPNEVLTYKTAMDEIDTASYKPTTFNFERLLNVFADSSGKVDKEAEKDFQEFNQIAKNSNLVSSLSEKKQGVIDIEMSLERKEPKKDSTTDTVEFIKQMLRAVKLRGSINENGGIQSFYVKNDQRNLLAILYELPERPIKIGDRWNLDVHFLSADQNFICDTSYRKNQVKLTEIRKQGNETIAVLKYDIIEYISGSFSNPMNDKSVKTVMKMMYNAIAEFSVEQGRWLNYNGIMSLYSSGIMNNNTTKRFCLIAQ